MRLLAIFCYSFCLDKNHLRCKMFQTDRNKPRDIYFSIFFSFSLEGGPKFKKEVKNTKKCNFNNLWNGGWFLTLPNELWKYFKIFWILSWHRLKNLPSDSLWPYLQDVKYDGTTYVPRDYKLSKKVLLSKKSELWTCTKLPNFKQWR